MTATAPAPDVAGTVFDEQALEVAHSYAEALIGAASKGGDEHVDAILGELAELRADLLDGEPRYRDLLISPTIKAADRDRFLVEALKGRALPTVLNFLQVLNRHGRMPLLGPILDKARATWDRKQNRIPVRIKTAEALDEGQMAALVQKLAALVGGTPMPTVEVDPSLLGGLIVQVGDDVYDASTRTQLEQLRKRLVEGKLAEIRSRSSTLIS